MKRIVLLLALGMSLLLCSACEKQAEQTVSPGKLRVVTTLFPLYDFARVIGGDRAEVVLLLPPGMEAHTFEPKPDDIINVNRSSLFIFTNRFMEPWAADIVNGINGGTTRVVDASSGARLLRGGRDDHHDHDADHHGEGMDPHLWLDFANAQRMVDTILAGFVAVDPEHDASYRANAAAYKAKLAELDDRYRSGLASCRTRIFLHGGHYAFGYLANRYGLRYESAYAVAANAEPSPAKLVHLIRQVKAHGLRHVYTEELVEPRIADTIARETGAQVLRLHGAHNISRSELAAGVTFLSLMEQNLTNLRIGLQCR
jgi:zinc transport system substrate-binding protein